MKTKQENWQPKTDKMTPKQALISSTQILKSADIKTASLDARILVAFILGVSIEKLYLDINKDITPIQKQKIDRAVALRKKGVPIAYITGQKEFYGLNFKVNKNVLIPRPETEELVEKSINFLKTSKKDNTRMLDLGTGSGNVIVSILKAFPACSLKFTAFATDISLPALKVAKENAKRYEVDNKVTFLKSDLFSNKKLPQKFDLIIANLPYVPKSLPTFHHGFALARRADFRLLRFEPTDAIFAEDNGTEIIKRFLKQAKDRVNKKGLILLELDPRNAIDLLSYAKKFFSDAKIKLAKDLAKFDRYLSIELN